MPRHEFIIKDLSISIGSAGGGGTWLPADDGTPIPWWISPIAAVFDKGQILESVNRQILETIDQGGDLAPVLAAFRGGVGASPAIAAVVQEIGAAVVASAVFPAIGGAVGYPDPDCGGSSLETIPPTITPIVHDGLAMHRISDLPKMRKQLQMAVDSLEKVAVGLAPRRDEVGAVVEQLKLALDAVNG